MERGTAKGVLLCVFLLVLVFSSTESRSAEAYVGAGWTKHASYVLNVGAPGAWDDYGVTHPCVIKDGDTYKMWYSGLDGTGKRKIGYATSTDGISWTKYVANPVLTVGAAGAWDDDEVGAPSVIKDGSTYRMWYTGNDGSTYRVGYATSANGIAWTKYWGNPVVSLGAGPTDPDRVGVMSPNVIKEESGFVMWYSGYDGSKIYICMAYSGDGARWSKYDGTLGGVTDKVLDVGAAGAWDDRWVTDCAVLRSGDVYFMYYMGYDGATGFAIGLAYSTTGKTWTKYGGNPLVNKGAAGTWDDVALRGPCVIQDRLDFKMWYTGTDTTSDATRRIGYATNLMRMGGAMGLIDGPENTVYYIYPDYQGTKPTGTAYASLSDWTSLGMVIGMSSNNQYVTTDTHTSVVGADGGLVVSATYSAVICGGRGVSGPTRYYEIVAATSPAYFQLVGTTYYFYSRSTGTSVAGTAMSGSVVSTNQDMFIIMAFKHWNGRNVIILYGYGWKGSYAAALWFKYGTGAWAFGRAGIPTRENAYYIFKWTDANGDGFVDLSEISFVAAGS